MILRMRNYDTPKNVITRVIVRYCASRNDESSMIDRKRNGTVVHRRVVIVYRNYEVGETDRTRTLQIVSKRLRNESF